MPYGDRTRDLISPASFAVATASVDRRRRNRKNMKRHTNSRATKSPRDLLETSCEGAELTTRQPSAAQAHGIPDIKESLGDGRRWALKQRLPSEDRKMTSVALRIRWPHCVLDNDVANEENWNQDEANDSKAMMICRMGDKQQKQKANRRH